VSAGIVPVPCAGIGIGAGSSADPELALPGVGSTPADGTTSLDGGDSGPDPAALVACTVKV
jgi:hypothetical protein